MKPLEHLQMVMLIYPFSEWSSLTLLLTTSDDVAWLFSLFNIEFNQPTAAPSTTPLPAENNTSLDYYNSSNLTHTGSQPQLVQQANSPIPGYNTNAHASTSNIVASIVGNEADSPPGNTNVDTEPPTIPSSGIPRKFKCTTCGKTFNRRSRARTCEKKHITAETHACLGQCGVRNWSVRHTILVLYEIVAHNAFLDTAPNLTYRWVAFSDISYQKTDELSPVKHGEASIPSK